MTTAMWLISQIDTHESLYITKQPSKYTFELYASVLSQLHKSQVGKLSLICFYYF